MSSREMSHSPGNRKQNDRSSRGRREDSPRNHREKSYSRSPSRERKSYRDGNRDRRRDDRDGRRERSRSDRRYRSPNYSRSRSNSARRNRHSQSYSPLSGRRRHASSRDNPKPSRCLGVFGLSVYTTEDEVFNIFVKYGPIERVQVVIDAKTGRSRGFSFVYFENMDDAIEAKEQCSGLKIHGKNIRVDYSITQRAHTPTPGIYMGRPTYKDRYGTGSRDRRRSDRGDDYYKGSSRSSRHRKSPSPYYKKKRYERSRSRSYSPRRYY